MQVQWYREWLGPGPWVTCVRKGDKVAMRFWYNGDWQGGRTITLPLNEIEEAAARNAAFIARDSAGGYPAKPSI